MIRMITIAIGLLIIFACPVSAKEWARGMFETAEHDFGTIARGAKVHYDFVFQNKFKEDIHVASVRTSCNCTTPQILKHDLKTWEKTAIRAVFNTRSFVGARSATVTVVIDKPFFAEVQLTVKGYVRRDIVFDPGAIEFGAVDAGQGSTRSIHLKYAGRPNWKVTDVKGPNYYEINLAEDRRINGRVWYTMRVRLLSNAPAGYFHDQLVLETNDQKMKRIPLAVSGRIVESLTVSPAALSLGVVRPGEKTTKRLVVRANRPFRVIEVNCQHDDCFTFETPSDAKKVHLIPVTFTAGDHAESVAQTISIKTDLGGGAEARCLATVTVTQAFPVD